MYPAVGRAEGEAGEDDEAKSGASDVQTGCDLQTGRVLHKTHRQIFRRHGSIFKGPYEQDVVVNVPLLWARLRDFICRSIISMCHKNQPKSSCWLPHNTRGHVHPTFLSWAQCKLTSMVKTWLPISLLQSSESGLLLPEIWFNNKIKSLMHIFVCAVRWAPSRSLL